MPKYAKNTPKKDKKNKPRHEHSAGFILFRKTPGGPVFLLLNYGQHWDYPKGHLEKNESPWLAALRELKEETSIRQVTRIPNFQQKIHYSFISPKNGLVSKTVTYFLGKTRQENVIISDEHIGYAWLAYEDALERLTYKNAKKLLRAAHNAISL